MLSRKNTARQDCIISKTSILRWSKMNKIIFSARSLRVVVPSGIKADSSELAPNLGRVVKEVEHVSLCGRERQAVHDYQGGCGLVRRRRRHAGVVRGRAHRRRRIWPVENGWEAVGWRRSPRGQRRSGSRRDQRRLLLRHVWEGGCAVWRRQNSTCNAHHTETPTLKEQLLGTSMRESQCSFEFLS